MAAVALVAAFGSSTAGLTGGALTAAVVGNTALAMAGSILDQTVIFPALFPRDPAEGYRVDDWAIGQSAEGSPAGYVDGTARIEGVPIYLGTPIEEEVQVGGGKAGPDSTQYRYRRDTVVAFCCDVPAAGGYITTLWINGERVFSLSPDVIFSSTKISAETSSTLQGPPGSTFVIHYLRLRSPASGPDLTLLQVGYPVVISGFAHSGNNFTSSTNGVSQAQLDTTFREDDGSTVAVFRWQPLVPAGFPPPANPYQAAAAGPTISLFQDLPQLLPDVAESIEIYTGQQDQIPDPYIEAAVGSGKVPSYEGWVCVRLGGMNVTRYGNGVASFQAVVVTISPTNLGEHVQRQMARAGIEAELYDTFGMSGNFIGAVARGPQPASSLIGTALQATGNIASERDGRLIFERRPVLVDFDLEASELGAVELGEDLPIAPFAIEDAGDLEIPRAATVQHMDPELEWQTGAPRQFGPPGAKGEEQRISLRTWAMTRADASQVAWSAIWSAATNRQAVRFSLPPSRREVRVGHLVSLPVAGGPRLRALVTSRTVGTNGVILLEALLEAPEVHLFSPSA